MRIPKQYGQCIREAVAKRMAIRRELDRHHQSSGEAYALTAELSIQSQIINDTVREVKAIMKEPPGLVFCPGCHNEIDPDVCWCGSPIKSHGWWDGHSPVPLGCDCGRDKS